MRALGLDNADRLIVDQHVGHLENVTGTAVGNDGFLYLSTYGTCNTSPFGPGALYRAVAATP